MARRLLNEVGLGVGPSPGALGGKSKLDPKIEAYCRAAAHQPWFVLRDLDQDAACASALVAQLAPNKPPTMLLRVPVRAIEAWLLADARAIASFVEVAVAKVPRSPDLLRAPKVEMVNLARASRSVRIRKDMVPGPDARRPIGPAYTSRIIEFVTSRWSPARARSNSPSLDRCLRALESLQARR